MDDDQSAVLAANKAFYDAYEARDPAAMDAVWSRTFPVACIHPGWPPLEEREDVLESWRKILRSPSAPKIRVDEVHVTVLGDTAYVVCREWVSAGPRDASGTMVATNLFAKDGGDWRLVHHHSGPVAESTRAVAPPPKTQLN